MSETIRDGYDRAVRYVISHRADHYDTGTVCSAGVRKICTECIEGWCDNCGDRGLKSEPYWCWCALYGHPKGKVNVMSNGSIEVPGQTEIEVPSGESDYSSPEDQAALGSTEPDPTIDTTDHATVVSAVVGGSAPDPTGAPPVTGPDLSGASLPAEPSGVTDPDDIPPSDHRFRITHETSNPGASGPYSVVTTAATDAETALAWLVRAAPHLAELIPALAAYL